MSDGQRITQETWSSAKYHSILLHLKQILCYNWIDEHIHITVSK